MYIVRLTSDEKDKLLSNLYDAFTCLSEESKIKIFVDDIDNSKLNVKFRDKNLFFNIELYNHKINIIINNGFIEIFKRNEIHSEFNKLYDKIRSLAGNIELLNNYEIFMIDFYDLLKIIKGNKTSDRCKKNE